MPHEPTISNLLNKWTGPLTALSILIGGVIWLTSLHQITNQNSKEITEIKLSFAHTKSVFYTRLNELDTRLARMESKIDMLIEQKN